MTSYLRAMIRFIRKKLKSRKLLQPGNLQFYFIVVFREAIAQRQKSTDVSPASESFSFFRGNWTIVLFSEVFSLCCLAVSNRELGSLRNRDGDAEENVD